MRQSWLLDNAGLGSRLNIKYVIWMERDWTNVMHFVIHQCGVPNASTNEYMKVDDI